MNNFIGNYLNKGYTPMNEATISKPKPAQEKIRNFLLQNPGSTRKQILQNLFGITPEDARKNYSGSGAHAVENTLSRCLYSKLIRVDTTVTPNKWYAVEQPETKSTIEEGNKVSTNLPPSVDSFLQDISQMTELLSYRDVMNFEPSEEDLLLVKKLISKVRRKLNTEDLTDEQIAELPEVDQIVEIVKKKVIQEQNLSSDNVYEKTKQQLIEIKNCIPDLLNFYQGKITGTELYDIIVKKTPSLQVDYKDAYLDFLSQINEPKKIGEWTLPISSSGSFYTAFIDLDWIYNLDELTEEQCDELIADFKKKKFNN